MSEDTQKQHVSVGRLIDRERIRGASRMIPEGTDAKAVTEEQIAAVAADVEAFRTSFTPPISKQAIAKAAGWGASSVVEFIKGKYGGDRGQLAIDLEAWLNEEEERRRRPQTTQFVWTNVALKIRAIARYCLDNRRIGLIFGPDAAGIGKTTALQAIYQELTHRRATIVTMDKVAANPTGVLKAICSAMHIDDKGSNQQRFDRIVKVLRGRSHILLIDQIHNLRNAKDDKPLYILTDLWDRTCDTTAQLWCGTADMVTYLNRQQTRAGDESAAQLRRRIFPQVDLMEGVRTDGGGDNGEPLVSVEQVREMFARNKLKLTPSAAKWLCTLANLPDSGSVGLCVQIVEYVTAIASVPGSRVTSIDVPVLKEAMQLGMTCTRAERLMHSMDEQPARQLARVG